MELELTGYVDGLCDKLADTNFFHPNIHDPLQGKFLLLPYRGGIYGLCDKLAAINFFHPNIHDFLQGEFLLLQSRDGIYPPSLIWLLYDLIDQ